jgi:hypothetical protein
MVPFPPAPITLKVVKVTFFKLVAFYSYRRGGGRKRKHLTLIPSPTDELFLNKY